LKSTLVVEDNVMEAEQISRYLKEIGITSIVQPVIQGAMEKAILLHPSVILLDLHLPDGSGLDLLIQLKTDERTRNIPVIIASVEERRTEAIKLGAMGYLVKPFSQKDLGSELAKVSAFIHSSDPMMVIEANSSAPFILIADDNELIIQMLSDFLEAKGFRVISTRSGFEFLERAPELQPDIMLVDIQMPGMDGMETIRRLRAHTDSALAATPVIAITALAMSGDREKCLQAGANDYMSKPIVLTKLVECINQFLKEKTE
jgi:CheY-like chemotaxis protein